MPARPLTTTPPPYPTLPNPHPLTNRTNPHNPTQHLANRTLTSLTTLPNPRKPNLNPYPITLTLTLTRIRTLTLTLTLYNPNPNCNPSTPKPNPHTITLPGRCHFADERVKTYVLDNDLAPIRYVDDKNNVTEQVYFFLSFCLLPVSFFLTGISFFLFFFLAQYPYCPNGSTHGIAALCSEDGRYV